MSASKQVRKASFIANGIAIAVLTLFILVYYIYSSSIVNRLEDGRFAYRENFAWAMFQIQKQYLVLDRDVLQYLEMPGDPSRPGFDDILLDYNLLVSRIKLVRNGDGFVMLKDIPKVAGVLDDLDRTVAKIDMRIAQNGPEEQLVTFIRDTFEPFGDEIQEASVLTTNFVSMYNSGNIAEVRNDIEVLSYVFIAGLVLMICLLLFLIRNHQRAVRADIDVQFARQQQQVVEEAAEYAKMHALGTLAGGVAHEINTPAQYIQNNLEFLTDSVSELVGAVKRQPDGSARLEIDEDRLEFMAEEMPAALSESIQGLERIAGIVRGIRKFAHPTTDTIEPVSLPEEIETAITLTRNQVKHIAELDYQYLASQTEIAGRRNHLSQALINLIVNACQAIKSNHVEQGRIWLTVTSDETDILIRLRDNGGGVPDAVKPRIFDYFFTTKEHGVGTGQGLPICRKLIQDDFQGDLTLVDSAPGEAEFLIRLPLHVDKAAFEPD